LILDAAMCRREFEGCFEHGDAFLSMDPRLCIVALGFVDGAEDVQRSREPDAVIGDRGVVRDQGAQPGDRGIARITASPCLFWLCSG
jgi:hypothetical protein